MDNKNIKEVEKYLNKLEMRMDDAEHDEDKVKWRRAHCRRLGAVHVLKQLGFKVELEEVEDGELEWRVSNE